MLFDKKNTSKIKIHQHGWVDQKFYGTINRTPICLQGHLIFEVAQSVIVPNFHYIPKTIIIVIIKKTVEGKKHCQTNWWTGWVNGLKHDTI